MKAYPLKTAVIKSKSNVCDFVVSELEMLKKSKKWKRIPERIILVIASKVVSVLEGDRIIDLEKQDFTQLIHAEADSLISGSDEMYLTIKDGIIIPNAGIDKSNQPGGKAILWPSNPQKTADKLRKSVQNKFKIKDFGIMIVDSRITPMRRGTTGVALAVSGFLAVEDKRGQNDIYGTPLKHTTVAVADNLASLATLLLGEADECTPLCVIEDAPVTFTSKKCSPDEMIIDREKDLFRSGS